ncbi:hypothetical protein BKA70DRAFT_682611, partial [Coprinopsis sp. MPI-PUGE-AT-0042]
TALPFHDGRSWDRVIRELNHGLFTRLTYRWTLTQLRYLGWGEHSGRGQGWEVLCDYSPRTATKVCLAVSSASNRDSGIPNHIYSPNTAANPPGDKMLNDKPGYRGIHAIGEV